MYSTNLVLSKEEKWPRSSLLKTKYINIYKNQENGMVWTRTESGIWYIKKGHNWNDPKRIWLLGKPRMRWKDVEKNIRFVDINTSIELAFKREIWRELIVVARVLRGPFSWEEKKIKVLTSKMFLFHFSLILLNLRQSRNNYSTDTQNILLFQWDRHDH